MTDPVLLQNSGRKGGWKEWSLPTSGRIKFPESYTCSPSWKLKWNTYRTVSMLHEWKETFPMVSKRFPSKSLDRKENAHINTHGILIKYELLIRVQCSFDTSAWCVTHSQFSFGISRQMSSSFVKELFSKTLSIITTQWGDSNVKMSLSATHIQQKKY